MDLKLTKNLTELGLSENQANAYLSLLEIGASNIQNLAQKSGIKRTSLYFVLKELEHVGLVNFLKQNKKTYYKSVSPSELLTIFKNKYIQLESKKERLEVLYRKESRESRVLFFNSEEGFKQIWRRVLESEVGEYLIITDPRQMLEFVKKRYITGKIIKEKIKRGIKSRQLLNDSPYAKEIIIKDKEENRISKLLPSTVKIPFTVIIFGNNVAFISPDWENIIFLVESEALAQTQKSLFELAWMDGLPNEKMSKM